MGIVRSALGREGIRALRFEDPAPAADGLPSTRLTIGLTDAPIWTSVLFTLPDGRTFIPNVPTEEVFTAPHREKAEGWVRTSRPGFPMGREASGAYFRFAGGELVEHRSETGQDALDAFFKIPGARRLGEVALVEVTSPVGASGRIYHNTLYDENAAIHIAFGQSITAAYPGAEAMPREAREAVGLNQSDDHLDLMIGAPAMGVTGIRADGSEIPVMIDGRFAPEMLVSG
jgi:aminopeptidase